VGSNDATRKIADVEERSNEERRTVEECTDVEERRFSAAEDARNHSSLHPL